MRWQKVALTPMFACRPFLILAMTRARIYCIQIFAILSWLAYDTVATAKIIDKRIQRTQMPEMRMPSGLSKQDARSRGLSVEVEPPKKKSRKRSHVIRKPRYPIAGISSIPVASVADISLPIPETQQVGIPDGPAVCCCISSTQEARNDLQLPRLFGDLSKSEGGYQS